MDSNEMQELRATIDMLQKKIERYDWRLLDIEKRVARVYMQEDTELLYQDEQESYKEPILKKANKSPVSKKDIKKVSKARRYITWTILCAVVLGISVIIIKR